MPQRSEARSRKEDWTGVTSTSQRKKLQNRLNQRARRRRNAEVSIQKITSKDYNAQVDPTTTIDNGLLAVEPASLDQLGNEYSMDGRHKSSKQPVRIGKDNRELVFRSFAEQAYAEYSNGVLRLRHLPTLLGLNLFYAMSCNAAKLSVSEEWLNCDAISPFCQQGPGMGPMRVRDLISEHASYPEALMPTKLQLSVAHHPWIDLFPLPRFRDNVLSAIDISEDMEDELCMDSVEISDCCGSDEAFLIVWGEPWDPRGGKLDPRFSANGHGYWKDVKRCLRRQTIGVREGARGALCYNLEPIQAK